MAKGNLHLSVRDSLPVWDIHSFESGFGQNKSKIYSLIKVPSLMYSFEF